MDERIYKKVSHNKNYDINNTCICILIDNVGDATCMRYITFHTLTRVTQLTTLATALWLCAAIFVL